MISILLNFLQKKVGSPCHTLKISGTQQRIKPLGNVTDYERILKIYWPQTVTRVTEKDLYVSRNLFAEIGGYVGMFMGWSFVSLIEDVISGCKYLYSIYVQQTAYCRPWTSKK